MTKDQFLAALVMVLSIGGLVAALSKDYSLGMLFFIACSVLNQQRLWDERARNRAAQSKTG